MTPPTYLQEFRQRRGRPPNVVVSGHCLLEFDENGIKFRVGAGNKGSFESQGEKK